jgi:3-oxoacyl-[acyl-carrier protein] reductase
MLLKNKTAIVTGSSRGIGKAITELFALEGAYVFINCNRNPAEGKKLEKSLQDQGYNACFIQGDMTSSKDVKKLVNKALAVTGKIDILVNNASDYLPGIQIVESDWNTFQKEFDSNFKTALLCCQEIIPLMEEKKYGRIINLGATLITRPAQGHGAHITAKSALLGLTRELAMKEGPYGITVNMVSPGFTLTEKNLESEEDLIKTLQEKTPLKRLATPEAIAKAVLFYASDLSDFITGSYLPVDGGLSNMILPL